MDERTELGCETPSKRVSQVLCTSHFSLLSLPARSSLACRSVAWLIASFNSRTSFSYLAMSASGSRNSSSRELLRSEILANCSASGATSWCRSGSASVPKDRVVVVAEDGARSLPILQPRIARRPRHSTRSRYARRSRAIFITTTSFCPWRTNTRARPVGTKRNRRSKSDTRCKLCRSSSDPS